MKENVVKHMLCEKKETNQNNTKVICQKQWNEWNYKKKV